MLGAPETLGDIQTDGYAFSQVHCYPRETRIHPGRSGHLPEERLEAEDGLHCLGRYTGSKLFYYSFFFHLSCYIHLSSHFESSLVSYSWQAKFVYECDFGSGARLITPRGHIYRP